MRTDYPGVPEGYHTATPYLMVRDADQAVEFYRNAFGAVELRRSVDPNGVVRNVQIKIGNSPVMLGIHPDSEVAPQPSDALPRASIYLFVDDADRVYRQAVTHGATSLYPPKDQAYGYREGGVMDPFGITWWVATTLETNRRSANEHSPR